MDCAGIAQKTRAKCQKPCKNYVRTCTNAVTNARTAVSEYLVLIGMIARIKAAFIRFLMAKTTKIYINPAQFIQSNADI